MSERAVYTILGLVLLVGVELLRWLAGAPAEFCTSMTALAGVLMAGGPSLMKPPDQRGSARVGAILVLASLALLTIALTWGGLGCGTTELRGEESVTFQRRPGPTCYLRVLVDADKWVTVEAPFACVPPPEFCAPGPGEPGYTP